jgi:hypothetical protein
MRPVDHLTKARVAWGPGIPSWVERLAEACMTSSQNREAQRLGVSASMISSVLAAKYAGDMGRIEELCRGAYERATVPCPALGEIAPATCRAWAKKADRLRTGNNQNARMFRACRRCPRYRKEDS